MTFTLKNDSPGRTKPVLENPKTTQKVLFGGLGCEPGQLDLFKTDGNITKKGDSNDDTVTR
jgi:hypothetical protein